MAAEFSFTGYDNFVLEEEINSTLLTKLDLNAFVTPDYSLTMQDGLIVKIHRYNSAGEAEDLARGDGNSAFITSSYTEEQYKCGRTQAQTRYYDDDLYADSTLIEAQMRATAESMTNAFVKKARGEWMKSENTIPCTNYDLADFADAIAQYANKFETQEGLFFLASMDMVPVLRKQLAAELRYVEDYVRRGAVGVILGVPVYTSKAIPAKTIIMATKDAVHVFLKTNGVRVEQDRNIDTKLNNIVASTVNVVALVRADKCYIMGDAQATALTAVADVSDGTIAGAATTGATVYAYDADGVELGHATASGSAYSISSSAFAANDDIKVVAKLDGKLNEYAHIKAQA